MIMNDYPNCQEKSNRRHFSFSGHHKNFVVHKNGKNHGFGKKKLIRAILLYAIVRYTLSRFAVQQLHQRDKYKSLVNHCLDCT